MKWLRNNFVGGMNLQFEATRIGETEYPLLVNGRVREGTIRPVKKHLRLEPGLIGNYQGLYAANEYALLLVNGQAYLRNFLYADAPFNYVHGVAMSPDVPTIWAELVPRSTMNFKRSGSISEVSLSEVGGQSPAAVVLQDGIGPPHIIEYNGQGRKAQTYAQWNPEGREYVPMGQQMLYHDGILYTVSPDGLEIYRSVRGRPLDGMVNIDSDGNKLPNEAEGGASSVSHAVGLGPVTCLAVLNSPDNAIFAGALTYSVKVVPDYTNQIFGQPTFSNYTLFPTGPVNQFSFVESNGDNLLLNVRGIRSFNAALQMRNRGDNAPISRRVNRLFGNGKDKLIQSITCAAKWDDYALFGVSTIYGPGILVYDELLQQFVALDMQADVGQVKQFAVVTIAGADRLFFITTDNQLWEAYASDETASAQVYLGEFCSQDASIEFQPQLLRMIFVNALEAGTVTIRPFLGAVAHDVIYSDSIEQGVAPAVVPQAVPYSAGNTQGAQPFAVDLKALNNCWKFGLLLEWNCDAELSHLAVLADELPTTVPTAAEAKDYAAIKQ